MRDPDKFLIHLLLHELAHARDDNASENDCDMWAFLALPSMYEIHKGNGHMKPRHLLIIAATLVAPWVVHAADTPSETRKPSSGKWQIHSVVNGMAMREGKPGDRAENTILLDTETGKTWLLWPTKNTPTGYSWIELIQRKDAAKPPKAE